MAASACCLERSVYVCLLTSLTCEKAIKAMTEPAENAISSH